MPKLFSVAAARVLVCLALSFRSWTEHTREGDVTHDEPSSAAELAAMAGVTVRSVRRALADAQCYGFLRVERAVRRGRGRHTVYRLLIPHPRQWHFGDRTAAERQGGAPPDALPPPA